MLMISWLLRHKLVLPFVTLIVQLFCSKNLVTYFRFHFIDRSVLTLANLFYDLVFLVKYVLFNFL